MEIFSLGFLKSEFTLTAMFFLSGWLAGRLILPVLITVINEAGFLRPNFRGEEIPIGIGVVFFLSSLLVVTMLFFLIPGVLVGEAVVFLLALAGYTCIGLMDDFWGNGACKGLLGHMKSLFHGYPTTGSLKALAGGVMALFISAVVGPWYLVPLNALILALSVNTINLVDLRPGRAGKCFLLLGIIIMAAYTHRPEIIFTALIAGILLAYLPEDLSVKVMMGDAGSNALGAVIGLNAILVFDIQIKITYLAVLLVLNLIADKFSLTRIISSNRILDYLDRLGRE